MRTFQWSTCSGHGLRKFAVLKTVKIFYDEDVTVTPARADAYVYAIKAMGQGL